jgi:hypothetical protein
MENIKLTCSKLITILSTHGIKINESSKIDMMLDNYDIMNIKITKRTKIVKVSSARPGAVTYGGDPNPTVDISDNEYVVEFIDDCEKVYTCLLKDKYNIGERGGDGYPILPFYKLYTPEHHIESIVLAFRSKPILSESAKESRRESYKIEKEKKEQVRKERLEIERKRIEEKRIEQAIKKKDEQLYKNITTFPYQVLIGCEIIIYEKVNEAEDSWFTIPSEEYIIRKGIIYKFNENERKYLINFDDDTTLWIYMGSQKFTIDLEKFKENFDNKLINNSMYFIDKYIKIGNKIGKIDIFDNNKYHLTYKNGSGCWYDLRNVDIYLIEFMNKY